MSLHQVDNNNSPTAPSQNNQEPQQDSGSGTHRVQSPAVDPTSEANSILNTEVAEIRQIAQREKDVGHQKVFYNKIDAGDEYNPETGMGDQCLKEINACGADLSDSYWKESRKSTDDPRLIADILLSDNEELIFKVMKGLNYDNNTKFHWKDSLNIEIHLMLRKYSKRQEDPAARGQEISELNSAVSVPLNRTVAANSLAQASKAQEGKNEDIRSDIANIATTAQPIGTNDKESLEKLRNKLTADMFNEEGMPLRKDGSEVEVTAETLKRIKEIEQAKGSTNAPTQLENLKLSLFRSELQDTLGIRKETPKAQARAEMVRGEYKRMMGETNYEAYKATTEEAMEKARDHFSDIIFERTSLPNAEKQIASTVKATGSMKIRYEEAVSLALRGEVNEKSPVERVKSTVTDYLFSLIDDDQAVITEDALRGITHNGKAVFTPEKKAEVQKGLISYSSSGKQNNWKKLITSLFPTANKSKTAPKLKKELDAKIQEKVEKVTKNAESFFDFGWQNFTDRPEGLNHVNRLISECSKVGARMARAALTRAAKAMTAVQTYETDPSTKNGFKSIATIENLASEAKEKLDEGRYDDTVTILHNSVAVEEFAKAEQKLTSFLENIRLTGPKQPTDYSELEPVSSELPRVYEAMEVLALENASSPGKDSEEMWEAFLKEFGDDLPPSTEKLLSSFITEQQQARVVLESLSERFDNIASDNLSVKEADAQLSSSLSVTAGGKRALFLLNEVVENLKTGIEYDFPLEKLEKLLIKDFSEYPEFQKTLNAFQAMSDRVTEIETHTRFCWEIADIVGDKCAYAGPDAESKCAEAIDRVMQAKAGAGGVVHLYDSLASDLQEIDKKLKAAKKGERVELRGKFSEKGLIDWTKVGPGKKDKS